MHRLVAIAPLPPVPRHDLLTYRVPEPLRERVRPGVRVRVPLGRQTRTGVVAAFADALPPGELRSIVDVLDADPFLPADLLELCRWTARYYFVSLAEVIATIVPVSVPRPSEERALRLARRLSAEEEAALTRRAPARACAYRALTAAPDTQLTSAAARAAGIGAAALRALVAAGLAERVTRARAPAALPEASPRPALTPAQRTAADAIAQAVAGRAQACFLLHGITGSGKTEVFLAAAAATLAAGREVVLLVPEIALTHQLVERVRGRFGSEVAVLHSGLGPRERWSEWRRILSGQARVVVGARSAVFAPARRLGLVVVDEEHDAAYKQEEGLRYNARHLAVRHTRRPPAACPACGASALEAFGVGTEQIEAALRACYPLAVVDRLDRDAAQRLGAQRRILRDWRAGTTDILVGTQMVSKGHDVPGVTLVAVLLADLSLNVPDFRAAERTFQLLVQVAGRAGRGDTPGRVVVQTFRPEHPSVAAAAHHDYAGFMARELDRRRTLGYPPFARLVNLRLDGQDGAAVERAARELAGRMRRRAPELGLGEESVVGPAPPPLERVRGRWRWQILLRSGDVRALRTLAAAARSALPGATLAPVRLVIDVDPYSML